MNTITPNVIIGENVDVLSPFPRIYLDRLVKWMHQYKSLVTNDFVDSSDENIKAILEAFIDESQTFAIVDKHDKIGLNIEGPIVVGAVLVEPGVPINKYLHIVSQRRAWGKNLIDEGASMIVKYMFESEPNLARLSALMLNNNRAVVSFVEKQGFKREGYFKDSTQIKGELRDMVHYGLTRKNFNEMNINEVT